MTDSEVLTVPAVPKGVRFYFVCAHEDDDLSKEGWTLQYTMPQAWSVWYRTSHPEEVGRE